MTIPTTKTVKLLDSELLFDLTHEPVLSRVDANIASICGYSAEEFLKDKNLFFSLIHPDDKHIQAQFFDDGITEVMQTNLRVRHKNGRIRCIHASYSIYKQQQQSLLSLKIQEASVLKGSIDESTLLSNFSAMMDVTDDYIYFKDRNHVFTGASQTLVHLTDPSEHWSDLIGLTDYDVFPESYADEYYKLEKQIFSGEVKVAHEIQPTLDNEGNKGWVDNRKYPIKNNQGEIIGLFGIARDITELINNTEALRQSEQKFSTLVDSEPVAVCETDIHGQCRYVNKKWVSMTGLDMESSRGSSWMKGIHPNDREHFKGIWGTNKINNSATDLEFRFVQGNQETWFAGSVHPLTDEKGQITGFLGAYLDITERKKNEFQLIRLQQAAEEANRAKSEFLSNMSHELRTPMHGILSFAEFGINRFETANKEKLKSYFANIQISGKRLLSLLNDLLDLSKMEAGKMHLDFTEGSLVELAKACVQEQEQRLLNENISVKYKCNDSIPAVLFDSLRLGQVVTNLLSNAINFSPKGGEITFQVSLGEASVLLSVHNQGPQIPENELTTIFDAFIQSQKVSSKTTGTGLGLAICKDIIALHRGRLWAENSAKGEVIFTIELPAKS